MVAFDYLDTHTYPIIPAVKKSPSDIFVVFCLRSERLKNVGPDTIGGSSSSRSIIKHIRHHLFKKGIFRNSEEDVCVCVSKNVVILSLWNVAYV